MLKERAQAGPATTRGERIVEAWNAGDVASVLAEVSDDVLLEARLPKTPEPAAALVLRSKAAFEAGLARYGGPLPRFTLVNGTEDADTICLVLQDAEGHFLAVNMDLGPDGKVVRIASYRPDRPPSDGPRPAREVH